MKKDKSESINLELLLKSSILSKSKRKINGDELICNYPYLINNEENKEFNNQINYMLNFRNNLSDRDFGFFLAGLLEGDGHCGEEEIGFTFNVYDTSLAWYIKDRIQGGNIYKGGGNWVILSFRDKESKKRILTLTNGKFYTEYKLNFMKKYDYESRFNFNILPPLDFTKYSILNNAFLAGFTDSDGTFDLNLQAENVKTRYRISQKDTTIINILKEEFGGSISFDKKIECSRYQAVASEVIEKYIKYFETYPLLSTKYINYILWKKIVELKKTGKHLTKEGKEKIINTKNSMNTKLLINLLYPTDIGVKDSESNKLI